MTARGHPNTAAPSHLTISDESYKLPRRAHRKVITVSKKKAATENVLLNLYQKSQAPKLRMTPIKVARDDPVNEALLPPQEETTTPVVKESMPAIIKGPSVPSQNQSKSKKTRTDRQNYSGRDWNPSAAVDMAVARATVDSGKRNPTVLPSLPPPSPPMSQHDTPTTGKSALTITEMTVANSAKMEITTAALPGLSTPTIAPPSKKRPFIYSKDVISGRIRDSLGLEGSGSLYDYDLYKPSSEELARIRRPNPFSPPQRANVRMIRARVPAITCRNPPLEENIHVSEITEVCPAADKGRSFLQDWEYQDSLSTSPLCYSPTDASVRDAEAKLGAARALLTASSSPSTELFPPQKTGQAQSRYVTVETVERSEQVISTRQKVPPLNAPPHSSLNLKDNGMVNDPRLLQISNSTMMATTAQKDEENSFRLPQLPVILGTKDISKRRHSGLNKRQLKKSSSHSRVCSCCSQEDGIIQQDIAKEKTRRSSMRLRSDSLNGTGRADLPRRLSQSAMTSTLQRRTSVSADQPDGPGYLQSTFTSRRHSTVTSEDLECARDPVGAAMPRRLSRKTSSINVYQSEVHDVRRSSATDRLLRK